MLFITSSTADKVDGATRKLIRSHVRQGKGQKKKQGPTIRYSKAKNSRIKLEDVVHLYTPPIPARVGSDVSFLDLAADIEPAILLNMIRVSTIAMQIIFPLLMAIGYKRDTREWLYILSSDPAALHITAWAMEEFMDRILCRRESSSLASMLHFGRGVGLLRKRLVESGDEMMVSDTTMGTVLKLASAALVNGDAVAAGRHMVGLRRMVDVRGGLVFFRGKYLMMEMLRCDLSIALLSGSNTVFLRQPEEQLPSYPSELLDEEKYVQENVPVKDTEMATAWRVMRKFSLLVNLGTQTRRFMRQELIQDAITAVMYRLLNMSFATGSLDEVVRLGLLAFCHHVFLQWQDIKLPYRCFPDAYRHCILKTEEIHPSLMLWLLVTGAVTVFGSEDEAWMRELLQEHAKECQVKTEKEMQDLLNSFMWIPLLDKHAEKVDCDWLPHMSKGW